MKFSYLVISHVVVLLKYDCCEGNNHVVTVEFGTKPVQTSGLPVNCSVTFASLRLFMKTTAQEAYLN